jgi:spermidine/putrescine transport system substrate-binding protein
MVGENLLAPISLDAIANFANITTQFKNPPYDPDNTYTVPYQWGTIGLGYNHDTVGKDLTSWADMFNSDKKVAWLDEPRPMLGFALEMLGDDPNTSDTAQIQAAGQYLIEHSKNVIAIAPDNGQDLLAAGQADIVVEYSGDIFQVIADCGCDRFRYDIPIEGSVIWVDNLAIPKNAKNKPLAQVFMDYILNAQVGADISNFTSYATPNQTAIDEGLIDSASLSNPAIYPDEALQSKLFFVQSSSNLEQKYSTVWDTVKKAVGK